MRPWTSRVVRILGLLTLILATAAPSNAQDDEGADDETPTFYATATVWERPVDDAAGSVTVIDRDTVEASGARTVAEILSYSPGLYVSSGATRGGVTSASIRGGDPNFAFVLLDGVPLNDVTDPQGGAVNLGSLPATLIEKIEIVRGPTSSFYGSTGLSGIIHLFTRRGDSRDGRQIDSGDPRVDLEIEGGNASLRRGVASLGGSLDAGGDYFLGGSWEEEAERIATEEFEQWNLQGGVGWAIGSNASLRLSTRASSWQASDYPEASGGPIFGSGDLRDSDHDELSLGAELLFGASPSAAAAHPGADHRQRLSATWYQHDLERDTPGTFPRVPPSVEETTYRRARLGWSSTFFAGGDLEISGGIDVEREQGRNLSTLLLPPFLGGAVSGDYDVDRTQGGGHLQLTRTRGNLGLELGLRFDAIESGDTQLSPRLGLSYRPAGNTTRLRISAGRAFKLPSFFALASPAALGGNPDLEPETSIGVDVGLEHDFRAANLRLGLTLFANRFEDLVDFDFDTFNHINRSEVESQGIELMLDWRPTAKLRVAGDITWQEVEDQETGLPLLRRPDRTGSLRVMLEPSSEVSLWLVVEGTARLPDQQIPVPQLSEVAGYNLVHLAGSWSFHPHWQLRTRLDNLLDEDYETLIGFPGPDRSARLSLRFRH